jgi:hypothetical protein
MTPDFLFNSCSSLAFIGWLLLLIVSPFWLAIDRLLIGIIITLFALVYIWLIGQSFNAADMEKFSTLDGVMSLFTNKTAVAAGWVHYLAFDLMTGIWIKNNSVKYGIHHGLIIPCLLFTFMLGPVGLLMYLLIRWVRTRQYFAANF